MEEKLKKDIKPLPEKNDDFWQVGRYSADNRTFQTRKIAICKRGHHSFEMTKGTEAKCRACMVGYILSPGMIVKSGKIFQGQNFVV